MSGSHLVIGHNFSSNESTVFFALVEMIKGQALLVQENKANNNSSLAIEHANKTLGLLTDDVNEEIAERKPKIVR